MSFKVGQKVVCVDASVASSPNSSASSDRMPKEGEIYTVRALQTFNGMHGILLEEITTGMYRTSNGDEIGYMAFRFRPVDEQWAEDVLADIAEKIEEEFLVLVS